MESQVNNFLMRNFSGFYTPKIIKIGSFFAEIFNI